MLNLDNCLAANRPCIFVVCESDIEVLKYLDDKHKGDKFSIYSKTLARTIKLSELLKAKFSPQSTKAQSLIEVLHDILHRSFNETNNHFESYVFLNADNYISDPQTIRYIKDILTRYQLDTDFTVNLIFISQVTCVPSDLERLSEVVFFDLPDKKLLKEASDTVLDKLEVEKKERPSDEVVNNLKGLTLFEVEQAYLQSWQIHKKIDLDFIRNFKKNSISKTDLLTLMETGITFEHVGGASTLKNWIKKSYGGWTIEGQKFGLPLLKGLLMVGLPGCGKAQPLDSLIYTPNGPIKMGNVKIRDTVCTPNGKTAKIIKIYPQGIIDIYRITFSDGATVECCEDHLWKVSIREQRHQADKWIVPTKYLLNKIKGKDGSNNIYVETPIKANFKKRNLKIDPYIMGLLIGDGTLGNEKDLKNKRHLEFTSADKEIVDKAVSFFTDTEYEVKKLKARKYAYSIRRTLHKPFPNKYMSILKEYGLWGKKSENKFIPEDYLYSSHEDRVLLLKGLMDTDGCVDEKGMSPCFSTSSEKLMLNFTSLIESLGGYCINTSRIPHFKDKNGDKKEGKLAYRCWIKINLNPFSLKRKAERIIKRTKYKKLHRIITNIEFVGKKEAQCITLDDVNNLYITDNYIITHNSLVCKAIGNEWGLPVISFDPSRVFSSRVGESEHNIRRVLQIVENISPCILFIDEIEKGFAGSQSSTFSDSGVTARVIGSFLTWMQDCNSPVFTIATSNNIQYLPPELIQRFDEKFFINLPQMNERVDIYKIHLKKLNRQPSDFDLEALAQASTDLSGREIEQALRESMYDAFAIKKELSTQVILSVLGKKTNLITTMAEQLRYLLDWVGWDENKLDGIRARFAHPVEGDNMTRVKDTIDKMIADLEKNKSDKSDDLK
jgi:SpoVK/Ycf46/Vps4 family AAA+-type ATPase